MCLDEHVVPNIRRRRAATGRVVIDLNVIQNYPGSADCSAPQRIRCKAPRYLSGNAAWLG